MPANDDAIQILDFWYKSLTLYQDKLPSRGTVAAALIVLQRLRSSYQLDISAHVAGGEAQITGLSASSLKLVLAQFGETRPLSSVAGRSNRGARGDIAALLDAMRPLSLENQNAATRKKIIQSLQQHIVKTYVSPYFSVKRVKAMFETGATARRFVHVILENARLSGKAGAVAEYLVGAKLALKFPTKEIRNKRFSTSDEQRGFAGDFEIGNTVFHVTVAPMPELFVKCRKNLDDGLRVYLLVPESVTVGTRQNAELLASNKISVESIESFIATNIDEQSDFDGANLASGLKRFLEKYNRRVDEAEPFDKSMLIEIPPNLP